MNDNIVYLTDPGFRDMLLTEELHVFSFILIANHSNDNKALLHVRAVFDLWYWEKRLKARELLSLTMQKFSRQEVSTAVHKVLVESEQASVKKHLLVSFTEWLLLANVEF